MTSEILQKLQNWYKNHSNDDKYSYDYNYNGILNPLDSSRDYEFAEKMAIDCCKQLNIKYEPNIVEFFAIKNMGIQTRSG